MSPTLPPAQILRKRTNDSLNRLVLIIPSSATQEKRSPRHTVWYTKVDPSLSAGRFTLGKMERSSTLTARSKPQRLEPTLRLG
jgi:hypothetical protein